MIKNTKVLLLVICTLGFFVRLVSINQQSLWMDEAISAYFAKDFSYSQIINDAIKSDTHPPFYYLFLKFWTGFFGFSEFALRLPSVIFGTLTIFVVFLISSFLQKEYLKEKLPNFPLFAAFTTAFSPLLIYYSQEARMYSLTTFLVSALVFSYLQKKWLIFAITLFVLAISDYLPLLMVIPLWVNTFIDSKYQKHLKSFLIAHVGVFAFFVYWFPVFKLQSAESLKFVEGLPSFGAILGFATLKNLILVWVKFLIGRINFSPQIVYIFIVLVVSFIALYALTKSLRNIHKLKLIWLWCLLPVLIAYMLSFAVPGFSYFRVLYTLPAFIILLAFGFTKVRLVNLFSSFFLLLQGIFTAIYLFNPSFWREDWKSAVLFIESNLNESEVVFVAYPESFTPYDWYATKDYRVKTFDSSNFGSYSSFYTLDYLMDLTDPERQNYQKIKKGGFRNTKVYNFRGVGQIRYWVK